MNYTLLYYVQTNLICILIMVFIILRMQRQYKAETGSGFVFINIILMNIVLCLTDIAVAEVSVNRFEGCAILCILSVMAYQGVTVFIFYQWFIVCVYDILGIGDKSRLISRLSAVPAVVILLLVLTSPFTGLVFSVSHNGIYSRGPLSFIIYAALMAYLIASVFVVHYGMKNANSRARYNEIKPLALFSIAPLILATVQMFCLGASTTQIGITISCIIIYESWQDKVIQTDALTSLNNRRALVSHIEDVMRKEDDVLLTFIMLDVDKFKKVNDNYGHMVGDQVLRCVSDGLKYACRALDKGIFLCRYGGDEFLIIGRNFQEGDSETYVRTARNEIKLLMERVQPDIKVEVSVGVSSGLCSDYDQVMDLIEEADKAMYRNKKRITNDC